MSQTSLPRRSLAKAAAWSAPVLLGSTAVPAYASSQIMPNLVGNADVTHNNNPSTERYEANGVYIVRSATYRTSYGNYGARVYNTRRTSTITDLKVTYWLPQDGLTFANNSSSASWSVPLRDASKANYTMDGVTEYAYTSSYQTAITSRDGSLTFPPYSL